MSWHSGNLTHINTDEANDTESTDGKTLSFTGALIDVEWNERVVDR